MELERYRSDYQGKSDAIRRYIHISKLYEYVAFTFTLHHTLKLRAPLRKGDRRHDGHATLWQKGIHAN